MRCYTKESAMLKMVEECSSEALAEMVLHDGIALAQKAQAFSGVKGRITMDEVVEACKVMAIARNTQQLEIHNERGTP